MGKFSLIQMGGARSCYSNLVCAVFFPDRKTNQQELIPKLRKLIGVTRSGFLPKKGYLLETGLIYVTRRYRID